MYDRNTQNSVIALWLVAAFALFMMLMAGCDSHDHNSHHHIYPWHECDLTEFELENITGDNDPFGDEKDYVVINFESDVSSEEIGEFARSIDLDLEPTSYVGERYTLYKAEVPEGSVPQIHAHIFEHGHGTDIVKHVEEKFALDIYGFEPDDPLYQYQWNMRQIQAEEAWTMASGKGAVVAVLDTGISFETDEERNIAPVKDLEGNDWTPGYDFIDDTSFVYDGHGHGTHVAGTIAQTTDNSYGTVGLAYNASLMPVKVLSDDGRGTSAQVADGIRFAAENGADVINMSLGSSMRSEIMHEAVQYARNEHDVTIVAAAGNNGKKETHYPAGFDEVIAVAATQYDGDTAYYSQWGKFVDIAAPGGNTKEDQNGDGRPDGILQETIKRGGQPDEHFFALYQGTSMASPHVAATVALMHEWGVTRPDAVERYLFRSTDESMLSNPDAEEEDGDEYLEREYRERFGSGLLQADEAVTSAIMRPSMTRGAAAFLLAFLLFFVVRRGDYLDAEAKKTGIFLLSALYFAGGLFLLPFIVPFMEVGAVSTVVQALATPIATWDAVVFGVGQTPLSVSFLLPLIGALLFISHPTLKYVVAGMATGFAGFALAEAFVMTSTIMWIPGGTIIDRLFLVGMAAVNMYIAFATVTGNLIPQLKENS